MVPSSTKCRWPVSQCNTTVCFIQHSPGSATASYKQLLLNVDVAATAFFQSGIFTPTTGPLPEVVASYFKKDRPSSLRDNFRRESDARRLSKFLRGVVVNITYKNASGRKRYKIGGISSQAANATTVEIDGVKMTVEKYFYQTYNISLQYPWLPCITTGLLNVIQVVVVKCRSR